MGELRTAIQKLAGTHAQDTVQKLTCSVDSVDLTDRSCMATPINSTMTSFKAYLMAETDDGLLIVPTVGSTVKIIFSTRNAPTVIQYSQIDQIVAITDQITATTGNQSFSMKDGLVQFNDGSFGGLVKVQELVSALNIIQRDINNLKKSFLNWATSSGDGGAALKTQLGNFYSTDPIAETNLSDIENNYINHGK